MLNFKVKLSSADDIRDFVNRCCELDCDIDLAAGRYIVDAKSLLGVFSVDLTRNLELSVYSDDKDHICSVLQPYMV